MSEAKMIELKKDAKLFMAALAFSKKDSSSENIMFWHNTGNNEAIYKKYLDPNSSTSVNITSRLTGAAVALAKKENWDDPAWTEVMKDAKHEIERVWDSDIRRRFIRSDEYAEWSKNTIKVNKIDISKAAKMLGISDEVKLKRAMVFQQYGETASAEKLYKEIAVEENAKIEKIKVENKKLEAENNKLEAENKKAEAENKKIEAENAKSKVKKPLLPLKPLKSLKPLSEPFKADTMMTSVVKNKLI